MPAGPSAPAVVVSRTEFLVSSPPAPGDKGLGKQIIESLEITWLSALAPPRPAPPPRPVPAPIAIAPDAPRPLPESESTWNLPAPSTEPMPRGAPLLGLGLVLAGLAAVAGGLWYYFLR